MVATATPQLLQPIRWDNENLSISEHLQYDQSSLQGQPNQTVIQFNNRSDNREKVMVEIGVNLQNRKGEQT